MRLQRLVLRNFKGARKFDLEADGQNVNVFADNAVGKTTLFDAFTWALFGKDSHGRADFEIKTLNEHGEPVHKIEHEVELVLSLGDEDLALRKVFKEKWVKPRGRPKDEFSGHETKYYIDGVPVQKKEYDGRVGEVAPEDVFRLLTDPTAFNALHWQRRRELLLEVCGDVSDADVIESNEELAGLPEILGKHTLEDHKKVIEARRREINQELKELPARIDEVTQGLPDLPGIGVKKLEDDLKKLRKQRSEIQEEQVRVQAGGETAEKRKRHSEIQVALKDVELKARGAIDTKLQEARRNSGAANNQVDAKEREVRNLTAELEDVQARVETLEERRAGLREEWKTVTARQFDQPHDDENCPVCGQALPEHQVQAAHERALEEFNQRQAIEKERIQAAGQKAKAESERLESQAEDLKTAIAEASKEVEGLHVAAGKAAQEVARLEKALPDVSKNQVYQQLLEEQAQVQAAIEELKEGNEETLEDVRARLAEVDEQINTGQADLSTIMQRDRGLARIEELKGQEQELSTEFERLEQELYLCETFIRSKVSLLTDRINSKFELAQFKLFDEQINGGLAEACEAMHNGVPYGSLNHGARVQVGLDIVRTLQAHYGLFPPVWVDNRESVTSLPDMSCQVISLVVSESDKKLRVELGAPERQEVAA